MTALISLLALGCAGGGEHRYSFDPTDISGLDVWAQWGEVEVIGEDRSDIAVQFEGGGVGGNPMPVLTMLNKNDRPGNFPSASRVPNGRPMNKLSPVARAEICSDRTVIWKTSASKIMK